MLASGARDRGPRPRRSARPRPVGVASGATVSSGSASSALSVIARRRHGAVRGGRLVLGGVERQFGLQHLEPRRVAASKRAGPRRARAARDRAARRTASTLRVGDEQPEVGAADVVADLRHRRRQLGFAGADRRLADRNAPVRACRRVRAAPTRRRPGFGVSFSNSTASSGFGCSPATGKPRGVDRPPEPGRGDHRVGRERAVHRRPQRQRLAGPPPGASRAARVRRAAPACQPTRRPPAATSRTRPITRVRLIDRSSWCRPA